MSELEDRGYKNPPSDIPRELDRGTVTNPTASSIHNAADVIAAHREKAQSVYDEVYKQARAAGYGHAVAAEEAKIAKDKVDQAYIQNLRHEINVQKSHLAQLRRLRNA